MATKTPEPVEPTEEAPLQVEVSPGEPVPAYGTGGRRGYNQETGEFVV